MQPITDKLFDFLVSGMSGDHFEKLAKRIFSAAYGEEFTPLAGMHDGGAVIFRRKGARIFRRNGASSEVMERASRQG